MRALSNPHVTFLGHLTGRLLLTRDGYAVDVAFGLALLLLGGGRLEAALVLHDVGVVELERGDLVGKVLGVHLLVGVEVHNNTCTVGKRKNIASLKRCPLPSVYRMSYNSGACQPSIFCGAISGTIIHNHHRILTHAFLQRSILKKVADNATYTFFFIVRRHHDVEQEGRDQDDEGGEGPPDRTGRSAVGAGRAAAAPSSQRTERTGR